MKFDTLQQGISFYKNYARISGFDTRLYSTKKRKSDGKISLKYCVCNKEGFRATPRLHVECKKKTNNQNGVLHSMIAEEDVQIFTLIDHKRNSKLHRVRYHLDNNRAECSCKMYKREGIPCRHILWVIKEKGLKSLPTAYVKTRWTKAAMSMPMFDLGGNLIEDTIKMEAMKRRWDTFGLK
ncbi:Protein FAR1-RELATED SEQUENCE 5 [Bienertia sinuspersici]